MTGNKQTKKARKATYQHTHIGRHTHKTNTHLHPSVNKNNCRQNSRRAGWCKTKKWTLMA